MSDLYADGFEPAMSLDEKAEHLTPPTVSRRSPATATTSVVRHAGLRLPHVVEWPAGDVDGLARPCADTRRRLGSPRSAQHGSRAQLTNIRRLVAITTHGSSKLINLIEGETGRRVIGRAVRVLCHRFARTTWLAMYNIDRSSAATTHRIPRSRGAADQAPLAASCEDRCRSKVVTTST